MLTGALISTLVMSQAAPLPFVSPIFGDHMVLQRDKPNTFWGWSTPGATVTVSIDGREGNAVANESGKWMTRVLPPSPGGPYEIQIKGPETVVLKDVLVGDVWVCSGQSNMEMGITQVNDAAAEIAAAKHPQIRLYNVPHATSYKPIPVNPASWMVCSPESIASGGWGGFSAVGYFFGRDLQAKLNVPIGLVQTAWGGTIAEAWTSADGLKDLHDFDARVAQVQAAAQIEGESHMAQVDAWFTQNDPETDWLKSDYNDAAWTAATGNLDFNANGLGQFDGLVRFRRLFIIQSDSVDKPAKLVLGPIDDADATYLNGQKLGSMAQHDQPRTYAIPAGLLKTSENILAVRVFDGAGPGGIMTPIKDTYIELADGKRFTLEGGWKIKPVKVAAGLTAFPPNMANNPNVVTVLHNGMIAPITPLSIRGAIWYQGESNADRAYQYRQLLPAMIGDWRKKFGQGDFPFLIVQLANFMAQPEQPVDDYWAELREAQAMTAKRVRNTGLAVAIDIGDAADIHPKDKLNVGKRLALQAFKVAYGHNIAASGPTYRSMSREGSTIRLTFDNVQDGLVDKSLQGFAIAGDDRKFYWATAKIDGKTILVSAPEVERPAAVRYAWSANPVGATLYNSANLPAVPFRTDDWPGLSVDRK